MLFNLKAKILLIGSVIPFVAATIGRLLIFPDLWIFGKIYNNGKTFIKSSMELNL